MSGSWHCCWLLGQFARIAYFGCLLSLSGLIKSVYKGHTALFLLFLPFPFLFMLDFLVIWLHSLVWIHFVY